MQTDICRAEISLETGEALRAWNAMVVAFLGHGADTPDHLARVLAREPGCAMAHAAKGLFCMLLGRRETVAAARDALRDARAALAEGHAGRRERGWVAALETWLAGHPSGAVFHLEDIVARNPADTLSMKLSHAIRFVLGDAPGMRRSVERVLHAHDDSHPLKGFALGCHAFALEETRDYAAAEKAGLQGLSLAPSDAWGLHAVAHVYDMTHRPEDGIRFIDDNRAAWGHCNNFRFHVWWHKALLHLDRGEHERVLTLYDTRIREEKTDDYRDFANASSLLMRLELEGVECGDRWAELADLAEARLSDGCLVFADLHYMLALTGDSRPGAADRLSRRIAASGGPATELARIADHPGRVAAEGLAAFGEGQYARAFAKLQAARAHMPNVGGSHAQRDVFERITVDAGIRAGQFDAAAKILAERTALRDGHADAFAESRNLAIGDARKEASLYAAQ